MQETIERRTNKNGLSFSVIAAAVAVHQQLYCSDADEHENSL